MILRRLRNDTGLWPNHMGHPQPMVRSRYASDATRERGEELALTVEVGDDHLRLTYEFQITFADFAGLGFSVIQWRQGFKAMLATELPRIGEPVLRVRTKDIGAGEVEFHGITITRRTGQHRRLGHTVDRGGLQPHCCRLAGARVIHFCHLCTIDHYPCVERLPP